MQTTENFGLTIYEANDVTSYLNATGWNGTMTKIDAAMKTIQTAGTTNATDIASLENQMTTANDEINHLTGEVSQLQDDVSGNTSNIAGLNTRVIQAESTIETLSQKVDVIPSVFRGVLTANETTLAIPIDTFNANTLVDVYASIWGLFPLTMELRAATDGQPNLCVTTWDAQGVDVSVAVTINNAS